MKKSFDVFDAVMDIIIVGILLFTAMLVIGPEYMIIKFLLAVAGTCSIINNARYIYANATKSKKK